jgi:hypothetical protein
MPWRPAWIWPPVTLIVTSPAPLPSARRAIEPARTLPEELSVIAPAVVLASMP